MTDDAMWKRRFFIMMLGRLGGTALVLLGMVVAFSNAFHPGGNRALGIPLIVAGLVELVGLPIILRRQWRQP